MLIVPVSDGFYVEERSNVDALFFVCVGASGAIAFPHFLDQRG